MELLIMGMFLDQKIMDFFQTFFSIIIIGIDHGKWCVDHIFAAQQRLSGSPRLFTSFRNRKTVRKIGKALKDIFHFGNLFDALTDDVAEIFFNVFADDKDDFVKACLNGIIDGIITSAVFFIK